MKWYRPIPCDNTVNNPLVCEYSNIAQLCKLKDIVHEVDNYFFQGKEIENWSEGVFFTTQKEKNNGEPDDVLQNGYMLPIFSERLVNAILDAEIKGFQFLPITVLNYHGETVGIYYIANCVNMFDAFDYEKSSYTRFSDDFPNPSARGKIVCSKFVLIEEKLNDYDVFRMQGQSRAYFVSEQFVKIFRQNKFTGYSFQKIQLS